MFAPFALLHLMNFRLERMQPTPIRACARLLPLFGLGMPFVALFSHKGIVALLGLMALASIVDFSTGTRGKWVFGRLVPSLTTVFLAWSLASLGWEVTAGLAAPRTAQLVGLVLGGGLSFIGMTAVDDMTRRRALLLMAAAITSCLVYVVVQRLTDCGLSDFARHLLGLKALPVCRMFPYKIPVTLFVLLSVAVMPAVRTWNRIAVVLFAILLLIAVASSGNMTAAIAIVTGGAAWLAFRKGWRRPATVFSAIIVVMVMGAPWIAKALPTPRQAVEAWNGFPPSLSHRLMIWHFAADRISERPLTGWGMDASREIPGGNEIGDVPMVIQKSRGIIFGQQEFMPLHPHNNFLQIWLEVGGVGAGLYTCILLGLLWSLLGRLRPDCRALAASSLCMVLTICLASFGAWQSWWIASLWAVATFLIQPMQNHRPDETRACAE